MTLRCRDLSFSYSVETPLIPPFSWEIPTGKITAVVGKNGCGKSTLLRLLTGLLSPDSGSVEWEGKALTCVPLEIRAKRMALMSQSPEIPPDLTVEEFLLCGRYPCHTGKAADRTAVEGMMEACGLAPLCGALLSELSGGEKQKLFLAFSLIKDPEILFLDEPVSALDPAAQEKFISLLKSLSLSRERTVIMVLHDLELARNTANFLLGMKRGEPPFFLPAAEAAERLSALYQ